MTTFARKLVRIAVLSAVCFGGWSLAASKAHATWWACQPIGVIESNNRIHVECSSGFPSNTAIKFAAISNSNAGVAGRFVALANAALLAGKPFWVDVSTSSSTNTTGCGATDCRTPAAFGLGN